MSSRPLPILRAVTSVTTRTHCPYCAFQCGMAVTATSAPETALDVKGDEQYITVGPADVLSELGVPDVLTLAR